MEGDHEDKQSLGSRTKLYFAVASVNILYLCAGNVGGWTSPTLPKLSKVITNDEASLIGSLFSFGAAFGPIIAYACLDRVGRKGTLYVLNGCYLISWIILGISTNVYVLYTGRIIGGIGVGGTFSCASVFIAEIADKKIRGVVNSINTASMSIGQLMEYCIGPYTSYLILVIVSAIPSVLFFITFYFIPESPYYLMLKDREIDSEKALIWYRGDINTNDLKNEVNEIKQSVKSTKENKVSAKAILHRTTLKALGISIFIVILQQATGGNFVVTFAQTIFEIAHVAVSGSNCAIIGGVTTLVAGLVAPLLVRIFTVRKTYIGTAFGLALALAILTIFFYLQSIGSNVSKVTFMPILGLIMYHFFMNSGLGPLSWPIIAELFPIEVKGLATCISGVISSLTGFAVIEIAGLVMSRIGPALVFGVFCICIVIGGIVTIFLVPNTHGLTLLEIQEYLKTGRRPTQK